MRCRLWIAIPTAVLFLTISPLGLATEKSCGEHPPKKEAIIAALNLVPFDDGACAGYYKEMYACEIRADHEKRRPAASLIYYLMPGGLFDPWHKLASDEILVYHAGAPMQQLLIYPDGSFKEIVLGPDPTKGHAPQIIIPAHTWMGFRILDDTPEAWGLYGVFCAPGWHFDDITMSTGPQLGEQFPDTIEPMKRLRMYE
ncbi:MAG: cupin domain-containing protein [Spartobacteria bacterium]|nr:cupin domain-containing protein [Spartobacteria bacterium]